VLNPVNAAKPMKPPKSAKNGRIMKNPGGSSSQRGGPQSRAQFFGNKTGDQNNKILQKQYMDGDNSS